VADGGEGDFIGGDRAVFPAAAEGAGGCGVAVQGGGCAGADQLGGGQPGQNSCMTRRGEPERSTGPDVRSPAPAMVALSSPNVVSDALHRAW
jgi:hypothetical protein